MTEWKQNLDHTNDDVTSEAATASTSEQTATELKSTSGRKFPTILAGTVVVAVVAGLLFQLYQAEPTKADTNNSEQQRFQSTKYAARVNGELITYEELANECVSRYGLEVLDNLVNRRIVQQACKVRNVQVTEAEVTQEIAEIAARFNIPVETWFQMLASERNLTQYQYKRDIIWPMLALKKIANDRISVTEEDLRKAYEREYGQKVRAKIIVFNKLDKARRIADELRKTPEKFEEFARTHSADPDSKALDGAIPPIYRHYPNENLERVAFELKEGQISGIVEIGVRKFAILKCEGRTEQVVTNFSTVREDLQKQLHEQRVQESIARIFEKLKHEATFENYLTNQVKEGAGSQSSVAVQNEEASAPPQQPTVAN